jgi:hypothetical protein
MVVETFAAIGPAAGGPAGGAALDQVAIATAMAAVSTGILLWLIAGHRSGRVRLLGGAAAYARRVSGLPGWASLPAGFAMVALLVALLGMYWDISLHIDNGRDPSPLANPAHYLILAGLFGVFAAGALAVALPTGDERPGPAAVRITEGWYAPVGGLLMAACGAFALVGFPLDDLWHRLFGQDVTLWGPTHLMLIGGAGMTLIGQAVLLAEGTRARGPRRERPEGISRVTAVRRVSLMGGLLIGLSTFQGEFDFGVPQYRLVFQPFLIALAAGGALVAARLWIGPGGALGAAGFFLAVRGIISLIVGVVFGETTPSLPLYVPEALCVELAGLVLARRPLALGAAAGALAGTVGMAAEWAWTQPVFRVPWRPDLLPEAVVMAVAGGVAGGLIGALLAGGLRGELPRRAVARAAVALAAGLVAACMAYGLDTAGPGRARATIALTPAPGTDGGRVVRVQVRVHPDAPAASPAWATITAWQGGGLHVARLRRVAPGVLRSGEAIPVHGEWKALVMLQEGPRVLAAPIYMPADRAIPVPGIAARARSDRPFVRATRLLQRERRDDVPTWLWTVAILVVLALYLVFLGALAIGVARLGRSADGPEPAAGRRAPRRGAPATPMPTGA